MNDWKNTSAKLGGISRTLVFQLWRTGELESVKVGRRRFSTDAQLARYVAKLESVA